jgi:hypothetical protein
MILSVVVDIQFSYLLDNVLVRGLSPIRKRKTPRDFSPGVFFKPIIEICIGWLVL